MFIKSRVGYFFKYRGYVLRLIAFIFIFVLFCLFDATQVVGVTNSIDSSTLLKKAKSAGLKPIPNSKSALLKLTERNDTVLNRDEEIELGKDLYFDRRLSRSNLISCNTCHDLSIAGDDGISAARGDNWKQNLEHLNSPTVYNAVFHKKQFWDGRSPNLEDQAQQPIVNPVEMASSEELVIDKLNSLDYYVKKFKVAYGKDTNITLGRVGDAIGAFERTLVTPSRFDDFLNGNLSALSEREKAGLNLLIDKGCTTCHNDVALGGTMQPFGVIAKYKYESIGGFKGDKNGFVKTATLRNITKTSPYFHNGEIWSLSDAIKEMGRIQLGLKISSEDAKLIEDFFVSLDGRMPKIVYPILPPSNDNTPKPDTGGVKDTSNAK